VSARANTNYGVRQRRQTPCPNPGRLNILGRSCCTCSLSQTRRRSWALAAVPVAWPQWQTQLQCTVGSADRGKLPSAMGCAERVRGRDRKSPQPGEPGQPAGSGTRCVCPRRRSTRAAQGPQEDASCLCSNAEIAAVRAGAALPVLEMAAQPCRVIEWWRRWHGTLRRRQ